MARYIFDLEADGFLDELTRIHSLVLRDIDSGEVFSFAQHQDGDYEIRRGVGMLADADLIVGHNVIKFDVPAITKVYPWFAPKGKVRDTMVLTRLLWPEVKKSDQGNLKKNPKYMPRTLIGKHTLEAWGHRLGLHKGDFKGPWDRWSEVMQRYCEQDVAVTAALWNRIVKENYAERAIELEHRFAEIIAKQERHGFHFDVPAAQKLYAELAAKRHQVEEELKGIFPPWFSPAGEFTPKRDNAKMGYVAGATFTKVKLNVFNPSSRDHVASRLIRVRGWRPKDFTDTGKPEISDDILSALPYPEAPKLAEYFLLDKRIGQLAEGKQAWLKVERNGRIYGGVITNGAVTRRCTHIMPNVAQVPRVGSAYGKECRALFIAPEGYDLVGCDASGLELRCLGHYMSRYDDGAYARAVVEGTQEEGTDVHTLNCIALGFEPKKVYNIFGKQVKGRDIAKTFIYAFLYGAGDEKIGTIVGLSAEEIDEYRSNPKFEKAWHRAIAMLQRQERKPHPEDVGLIIKGGQLKARFLKKTPGISDLRDAVAEAVKTRGYLKAIDGGKLVVRSAHAALNTLLQSAGAIAMKEALVILYDGLTARGLIHERDYSFVANIHDEIQAIVKKELVHEYGPLAADSIVLAGQRLGFRCPLAGEWKAGRNWAETH
jgi:DNA polymerase-1